MSKYIIISQVQAINIRGNYGIYSAINPIVIKDGNCCISERCLINVDLISVKSTIEAMNYNLQEIMDLPNIGDTCIAGNYYIYDGGLVKCAQTHNRTTHEPIDIPALFSFYRENSDELEWITNEQVEVGWKRIYDGVTYGAIQSHLTLDSWKPDVTPALWKATINEEVVEWGQPTGGHDAYNIDDKVLFNGNKYESLIDANVWSPTAYPAGWKQI